MRYRDKASEPKELPPQAEQVSDREEREITERFRSSTIVVCKAIWLESELRRSVSTLAWSGLAAGLSMEFSLIGHGLLIANLPDQPCYKPRSSCLIKLGS
ncbi:hypothetical protein IQ230_16280 [Gloeocapsopsis crepidinum LEGE 06123]|uniref:Uncharacterized protein n=1 Tax=Gloeocapsopsis crepidinum LEGE 06123 TaxID=588587 RepID=A0ABR9UU99_9CHRO|nr:hypothetical protein [Gloeocapsopsis crepidinum]MBE9191879.1 hypothetical protein [Gloeocapsopsis crepidinum LEGE 06123]